MWKYGLSVNAVEHAEGRQPAVARVDLPDQGRAVVGARVAAQFVAVDGCGSEHAQRVVQRRVPVL